MGRGKVSAKAKRERLGCSSVVEHRPSLHMALGSILSSGGRGEGEEERRQGDRKQGGGGGCYRRQETGDAGL
jgi:hypothetical protein